MAISFVNQTSATGTTANLPTGLLTGDMILVYAYRSALTAPSTAAGYTSISTQSANSNSHKFGYKFYDGAETTIGTWTNATVVTVSVYRNVLTVGAASGTTTASGTSDSILAVSPFTVTNGTSWVVTGAGSAQTTSMSTPATTTLRATITGTAMGIISDTNTGVTTYGSNSSALGAAAVSASASTELIAQPSIILNNYQFVKVGDGMSVSEKIR